MKRKKLIILVGEIVMSCCNKPPKGGSSDIGLMLKVFLGLFVVIFVLAALFG